MSRKSSAQSSFQKAFPDRGPRASGKLAKITNYSVSHLRKAARVIGKDLVDSGVWKLSSQIIAEYASIYQDLFESPFYYDLIMAERDKYALEKIEGVDKLRQRVEELEKKLTAVAELEAKLARYEEAERRRALDDEALSDLQARGIDIPFRVLGTEVYPEMLYLVPEDAYEVKALKYHPKYIRHLIKSDDPKDKLPMLEIDGQPYLTPLTVLALLDRQKDASNGNGRRGGRPAGYRKRGTLPS